MKKIFRLLTHWRQYGYPEPNSSALTQDDGESKSTLPVLNSDVPTNYGSFWQEHKGGLDWYTWMYKSRQDQHHTFKHWFQFINQIEPIQSVLEFGCGLAVGYADSFKDIRYVGTDIAKQNIAWCRANRFNSRHDYLACDFIKARFEEKFDLVFSQGTIDNTYDMDEFLQAAVVASRHWIYVTAYRGFFPHLTEHVYSWHEEHGCYYNDISPMKAHQTLLTCGCRDVAVLPSYTGREDIPFETVITARVADA